MQRLPINLLEPDMVVAKEVVNDKGIVLVSEGTALTEKLIFRLENMGIKKVMVKGCPVMRPDLMPKSLEAKLADMEVGFARVKDDPTMKRFRVILKAHFIKQDREARGVEDHEPAPQEEAVQEGFSPN
jgi:hypothetical protein